MQSLIDTIFKEIHDDFINYSWSLTKKNNRYIEYKNEVPYDEFSIESMSDNYESINVIIPVDRIGYKKTFNSIEKAVEYIKMHLKFYSGEIEK